MADSKVVLVPDGLDGERVDAAVARMLGLWAVSTRPHTFLDPFPPRVQCLQSMPNLSTHRPEEFAGLRGPLPDHDVHRTILRRKPGDHDGAHTLQGWPLPGSSALTITNILAAVDFSDTSRAACNAAVVCARRYGASLHVVHVVQNTSLPDSNRQNELG